MRVSSLVSSLVALSAASTSSAFPSTLRGYFLSECVADGAGGYVETCLKLSEGGAYRLQRGQFTHPDCEAEHASAVQVASGVAEEDEARDDGYVPLALSAETYTFLPLERAAAGQLRALLDGGAACEGGRMAAGEACEVRAGACAGGRCADLLVPRRLYARYRLARDDSLAEARSAAAEAGGSAAGSADEDEWNEEELEEEEDGDAAAAASDASTLALPADTMLLLTELSPERPGVGDAPRVAEVFKESSIGCEDLTLLAYGARDEL